jgi:thioredoxin 1
MLSLAGSLLVGGALGALLGYFGQCTSGTCPLTSTWWRGALYGGVLGLIFHFVSGGGNTAAMSQSTQNVKRISESQFEAEVTQSPLPVVVDFYADWCGPCRRLAPMLDELAGPLTNRVKFVKVNVDESPNLARRFEIQGIPALVFFRNGSVVDRVVGLPPADLLKQRLEALAAGSPQPAANR